MDDEHRATRDAVDELAARLTESEARVERLRQAVPSDEDLSHHMLQLIAGRPVYIPEEPPLGIRLAVRAIDDMEEYLDSLRTEIADLKDGDL